MPINKLFKGVALPLSVILASDDSKKDTTWQLTDDTSLEKNSSQYIWPRQTIFVKFSEFNSVINCMHEYIMFQAEVFNIYWFWINRKPHECLQFAFQDTQAGLYYNNLSYVALMTCSERHINGDLDRIAFAWYQLIVMFVFPVLAMLFCYSFVIAVLWNSTKEHARLTHSCRERSVLTSYNCYALSKSSLEIR